MRDKIITAADIITMWKEGKAIVTLSKDGHKVDMSIHSARWVTDQFNMTVLGSGSSQEVFYNYKKVSKEDGAILIKFFYDFFERFGGTLLINQRIKLTYREC